MLMKKIQFCDADESSLPPPVPPRRKRSSTASVRPTKLERKHRVAPPLPPPPAPQRTKVARKTPSPFPNESCSQEISSNFDSLEYAEASKNSLTETDENVQVEEEDLPKSSRKSKKAPRKPERSRSASPFEKSPEPNNYPPLYFTFQDFQTVMEGSSRHEQNNAEKQPELEKVIPCTENVEFDNERKEIHFPVTSNERNNAEKYSEPEGIIPFTENIEFDNVREEIYFRVTTTDRPFKNILTDWSKSYDGDVEDFEKEPQGEHIFDDYIDRSNKINKHLLINQQYFSMSQDEISISTERSTKVRFVIQSPSTSTPDTDLDYASYKEFVDKQLRQHGESSVQLAELNDDDIPSHEASGNPENKSVSEIESDTAEHEKESESVDVSDTNQTNDCSSDLKEDAKVISVAECIGEVLNCENDAAENVEENTPLVDEEIDVYRDDTIDSEEFEGANERRKVFIDSSLYNLSNEDEDWTVYLDKDKMKRQSSESSSAKISEVTKSLENNEQEASSIGNSESSITVVSQKVPKIEISTFDDKTVPESVRRNCFLEDMLNDDHANPNPCKPEIIESVNCEVIAAHPKPDQEEKNQEEEEEESAGSPREEIAKAPAKGNPPIIKSADASCRPSEPASTKINVSSSNKSAGQVKSDVLNELLTNFGAIKLRPVNGAAEVDSTVETKEEEEEEKVAVAASAKTDDETHEIRSSSEAKEEVAKIDCSTPLLERPITSATTSADKDTSAIVKEAPQLAERFDTDNKVKTPLAVNTDQIREAIAIIPGSVRNYIKYYEIHSEINSIAKLKDSMCSSSSSSSSSRKQKYEKATKGAKKVAKNEDKAKKSATSGSSPRPSKQQQQSCMKSLSPKVERKKSVQFDSEFTVINPAPKKAKDKVAKDEDEEGTFSSFIGGIRTRLKRKAPVKPDAKKDEQPKGFNPKEERRGEAAAIICIQKSPELKALTTIPGNRSFLPQTETLQNSPTIVFYCTV